MIELLTTEEMGRADRLAIERGRRGIELMEAAGAAVAEIAVARQPPRARVAVVCGPGNNGGDGFVAARLLARRGYRIRLLRLGEPDALRGDAAEAARRWDGPSLAADPAKLAGADVIVDALFGAGLARPIDGIAQAMIHAINASTARVLAIDLPSGINGNTGAVMGAAVQAHETVTFFRRKPGHLLLPGRSHCGRVTVADIGIAANVLDEIGSQTVENVPALWSHQLPVPRTAAHKYARGHAVVVSGGLSSTGAARLAARGALRAGAGLVTIACPHEALAVNAAANLAIMVRPAEGADELDALLTDRRLNAVVLGPGGGIGAPMREAVAAVLRGDRAVVLDADALTSFANDPASLFAMIAARGAATTVLTPHEGEFMRLFQPFRDVTEQKTKIEKITRAIRYVQAIILLKGPDTVVAVPDGRVAIAANATPWLATAGSGDVLAGMIGGLLAQGMPAFEAASAAVWLHGEAASRFGAGLISEDLPECLPPVLRSLLDRTVRPG